jgi:hypothetical protein
MTLNRYDNNFTSQHKFSRLSLEGKVFSEHPTDHKACRKRASFCPMASPNTVHVGRGQIRHIGSDTDSIAVELSMGKRFQITLKGKLSSDVQFDTNGRLSSILDFKIGDSVTIHWRNTKDGAIILALISGYPAQIIDFADVRSSKRKKLNISGI